MTSTFTTTDAANLNTVMHGDCVEIMRRMQSGSVDFVITDPPYITRYADRSGRTVANDDNARWLKPAFAQMHRLLKSAAFCVSFYGWNKADLFIEAWRSAGFRIGGHLVFRKRYPSSTRFLRYQHEQAYLLVKGEPAPPAQPGTQKPGPALTNAAAIIIPLSARAVDRDGAVMPGQIDFEMHAGCHQLGDAGAARPILK